MIRSVLAARYSPALACLFLILASACGGSETSDDNKAAAAATPAATESRASVSLPPADAAAAVTPAATAAPEVPPGVLEAKYYQDADGNAIPDFMEVEMGKDPARDDCATGECGDAVEGSDFFDRPHNTLLVLDSSGSMTGSAGGGQTKMEAAKQALAKFVRPMPDNFKMGFLVYGHKGDNSEAGKAESCRGVELLASVGALTPEAVTETLARFQPTGWTPIAAALDAAGAAFSNSAEADNRIIMVSDGLETCGGDPVAAARRLHEQGLKLKVDVVGFGVGRADEEQLRLIAAAGGGEYVSARTSDDLFDYFEQQNAAYNKTLDAFQCVVKNTQQFLICDQSMMNQVTVFRLPKLIREAEAAGRDQEAEAYEALGRRISRLGDERRVRMEAFASRIPDLMEKMNRLTDQRERNILPRVGMRNR